MTGAPSSRRTRETVLFPLAIPPVRPMISEVGPSLKLFPILYPAPDQGQPSLTTLRALRWDSSTPGYRARDSKTEGGHPKGWPPDASLPDTR